MTVISDTPPELLDLSFRLLDKKSLKALRLVNRYLNDIATPYCYETVRFDLVEVLPLKHLIQIARHEKLRRCVKRLVLQRRYGLRDYPFEKQQFHDHDYVDEDFDYDTFIDNYHDLSESELKRLSKEYDADRKSLEKQARQIAKNLQFRSLGCSGCTEKVQAIDGQKVPITLHDKLLQSVDEAIHAFSNLREFSHIPAYKYDTHWALRWRTFGFDEYWLYGNTADFEDEDVESLQISFVLRALGWANYFRRNLQSLRLDFGGPAFWDVKRLKWLWQGNEDLTLRRFGNTYSIDEHSLPPVDLTESEMSHYHEQLFIMKHAFTYLRHLDIAVSIEDERSVDRSVETVFNRTFDFLKHCEMLEELRFCIGQIDDWANDYPDHILRTKPLLDRLTLSRPWQAITKLELELSSDENTIIHFLSSVAKTLQKLGLHRLRILPMGGTLESFLARLGKTLTNLKQLQLSDLRDAFPRERVILRKWSRVWRLGIDIYANDDEHYLGDIRKEDFSESRGSASYRDKYDINPCYAHYEREIIGAILSRADTLPELGPINFLRAHQSQCANVALHERDHELKETGDAKEKEKWDVFFDFAALASP